MNRKTQMFVEMLEKTRAGEAKDRAMRASGQSDAPLHNPNKIKPYKHPTPPGRYEVTGKVPSVFSSVPLGGYLEG